MNQDPIDLENAFAIFATFCGDPVKSGAALGLPASAILRMSDEGGWADKLRPIIELKKSQRPGDVERSISRATNFAQAFKWRLFLQRVVKRISDMNDAELEEYLFVSEPRKDGSVMKKLSTRALTDMTAALEKAHSLCYMALGDSATERVKRAQDSDDGEVSASEITLQICKAMAAARADNSPRTAVFEQQLLAAQSKAAADLIPPTKSDPNNDDNH